MRVKRWAGAAAVVLLALAGGEPALATDPGRELGLAGADASVAATESTFMVTVNVRADGEPATYSEVLVRQTGAPEDSPWIRVLGGDDARHSTMLPKGTYDVLAGGYSAVRSLWYFPTYLGDVTRFSDRSVMSVERTVEHTIALVPSAGVSGRVVLPDGTPVKRVQVYVREAGGGASAHTNERGEFALDGLTGSSSEVFAVKGDYRAVPTKVTLTQGRTAQLPDLVLRPQTGKVTVRLSERTGNRSVVAVNTQTGLVTRLPWRTGNKGGPGNRTYKLPKGRYRLVYGGSARATKKFRVRPGRTVSAGRLDTVWTPQGVDHRLHLRAPAKRGTKWGNVHIVMLDRYGAAEFGFHMGCVCLGRSPTKKGKVRLHEVLPGRYTLVALDAKGWSSAKKVKVPKSALKAPQKIHRLDLTLREPFTISGVVTHEGKPVEGVEVLLVNPLLEYGTEQRVTTGKDGRYRFTKLPVVYPKLQLTFDDLTPGTYRRTTVKVTKAKDTVIDVELKRSRVAKD